MWWRFWKFNHFLWFFSITTISHCHHPSAWHWTSTTTASHELQPTTPLEAKTVTHCHQPRPPSTTITLSTACNLHLHYHWNLKVLLRTTITPPPWPWTSPHHNHLPPLRTEPPPLLHNATLQVRCRTAMNLPCHRHCALLFLFNHGRYYVLILRHIAPFNSHNIIQLGIEGIFFFFVFVFFFNLFCVENEYWDFINQCKCSN